jgi:hypothetical protein
MTSQEGQVCLDRSPGTGQPRQVSLDRSAWTFFHTLYSNGGMPTSIVLDNQYLTRGNSNNKNIGNKTVSSKYYRIICICLFFTVCLPSTYTFHRLGRDSYRLPSPEAGNNTCLPSEKNELNSTKGEGNSEHLKT